MKYDGYSPHTLTTVHGDLSVDMQGRAYLDKGNGWRKLDSIWENNLQALLVMFPDDTVKAYRFANKSMYDATEEIKIQTELKESAAGKAESKSI